MHTRVSQGNKPHLPFRVPADQLLIACVCVCVSICESLCVHILQLRMPVSSTEEAGTSTQVPLLSFFSLVQKSFRSLLREQEVRCQLHLQSPPFVSAFISFSLLRLPLTLSPLSRGACPVPLSLLSSLPAYCYPSLCRLLSSLRSPAAPETICVGCYIINRNGSLERLPAMDEGQRRVAATLPLPARSSQRWHWRGQMFLLTAGC